MVPCSAGVLRTSRQPVQLLGQQLAVVVGGHAGVEGHDPQPAHVVDPVLRARRRRSAKSPFAYAARSSWLPMHQTTWAPRSRGHRLDELSQPRVRVGLRLVREVAGEHQRLRHRVEPAEPFEGEPQPGLGHDRAVLLDAVGEQVGVAEMGDREPGAGVLAVLHGQDPRTGSSKPEHGDQPSGGLLVLGVVGPRLEHRLPDGGAIVSLELGGPDGEPFAAVLDPRLTLGGAQVAHPQGRLGTAEVGAGDQPGAAVGDAHERGGALDAGLAAPDGQVDAGQACDVEDGDPAAADAVQRLVEPDDLRQQLRHPGERAQTDGDGGEQAHGAQSEIGWTSSNPDPGPASRLPAHH